MLDREHLENIESLFQFLRAAFNHTIIITHLDKVTDYTDAHVTVRKLQNGLSHMTAG